MITRSFSNGMYVTLGTQCRLEGHAAVSRARVGAGEKQAVTKFHLPIRRRTLLGYSREQKPKIPRLNPIPCFSYGMGFSCAAEISCFDIPTVRLFEEIKSVDNIYDGVF